MRKNKIGGYHAVSIPLATSAKDALEQFKLNTVNFVELVRIIN